MDMWLWLLIVIVAVAIAATLFAVYRNSRRRGSVLAAKRGRERGPS